MSTWVIKSSTGLGEYTVNLDTGSCTCPHWQWRLRNTNSTCKHYAEAKIRKRIQDTCEELIAQDRWFIDFESELSELK